MRFDSMAINSTKPETLVLTNDFRMRFSCFEPERTKRFPQNFAVQSSRVPEEVTPSTRCVSLNAVGALCPRVYTAVDVDKIAPIHPQLCVMSCHYFIRFLSFLPSIPSLLPSILSSLLPFLFLFFPLNSLLDAFSCSCCFLFCSVVRFSLYYGSLFLSDVLS